MSPHVAVARRGGAALLAIAVAVTTALLLLIGPGHAAIVATVPLGTSANYSVLAGSAVTNTGNSFLGQSLGLSPNTASSITGFPPGLVAGTTDSGPTGAPLQAQTDLTGAYVDAFNRPSDGVLPGGLLGGAVLQGGVYREASRGALDLTGTLTLDAAGNSSTVFIFQTNSSLTTASSSVVSLINGAQACNVFWQIGSSATVGSSSVFVGNILALTSITVNSGATVAGRALARNGAVTLDDNVFTIPSCATSSPPTTSTTTPGGSGGGAGSTPTGGSADATPGDDTPGSGSGTPRTSGGPGVPSIVAPPRTGGGPLQSATFPWPGLVFFGVVAAAGITVVIRNRHARLRSATPMDH